MWVRAARSGAPAVVLRAVLFDVPSGPSPLARQMVDTAVAIHAEHGRAGAELVLADQGRDAQRAHVALRELVPAVPFDAPALAERFRGFVGLAQLVIETVGQGSALLRAGGSPVAE